ncbi:MAG: S8 family serine peptidase [Candidatus Methanoperedens sp.]|nr:S8 family serine peptidase [Candidatus Methanoperedens sp.]
MNVKLNLIFLLMLAAVFFNIIGIGNALNYVSEENNQIIDQEASNVVYTEKTVKEKPVKVVPPQGKIERALGDRIQSMGKSDKVRVAIWIRSDIIQGIRRPEILTDGDLQALTHDRLQKTLDMQLGQIKKNVSVKQKPVRDYLRSKSINPLYESSLAPVIFAEISKDDIHELEARNDVAALYLGREYKPLMDTSVSTVLAPPVWSYVQNGTKVAVIEAGGIAFDNPYLKDGIYYNASNPNIGFHPTAVAGIIASTHTTYKGIAYKGPALLSGNANSWWDSDLMAATDWAVANGARVLSNSWGADNGGVLSPLAYYYDWLVYNYGVTVVFAAGNDASARVYDPAVAYNVIAVGSFSDSNSGWNWWDDNMSSFSSYLDPPSTDREEPDVAAPGEDIISTTTAPPWTGNVGSGTSYAVPHVSGLASLLINKTPALAVWPEAVRAIIMASADHNIEGSSRLSDKDGAGGINALEAYKIASTATKWGGIELAYNDGAPWYSQNITASMGQRIRVVVAWDSNSTGYGGSDALNADMDLSIERLSGTTWVPEFRAGSSQSLDNNYEILDFNVPLSGKYRAKVVKFSWADTSYIEHLGYAVYIK